jgi:surfeit locus 1 family protein
MSRTNRFWPSAFTAAVVIILVSLGIWQLERLQWKQQLIGRIEARLSEPEIELPGKDVELRDLEYRKVSFAGKFAQDREARLFAINKRGAPGYHIFARFLLKDGRTLIVNRGWIPKEVSDQELHDIRPGQAQVTLTGRVRLSQSKGPFTPANDVEANVWYYADLDAIATYFSVSDPVPIFVELDDDTTGKWPRGGVTRFDIANNHLQYAITWFALAGVFVFMFGLWQFRERKGDD